MVNFYIYIYIYIYIILVLTDTKTYCFTGQIGTISGIRLTPLIYCILRKEHTPLDMKDNESASKIQLLKRYNLMK